MAGYTKGTSPAGELAHLRETFARLTAAIYAWPNPTEAWEAIKELGDVTQGLTSETAAFKGYYAAHVQDRYGLTNEELATWMGVSRQRVSQILNEARKRGNPVVEPTSLPEPLPVLLAVITSERGVLVGARVDRIPPWTFLGGEIQTGESPHDAAVRRVRAEARVNVTATQFIGRRVHPHTSRLTVYVHATVDSEDVTLGDPEDLSEVRWASVDETRTLMPDMYPPVRQYLDQLQLANAE